MQNLRRQTFTIFFDYEDKKKVRKKIEEEKQRERDVGVGGHVVMHLFYFNVVVGLCSPS